MARLAEIEAHALSMKSLLGVVSAMRSMAAIRVQEASRALPGVRRYAGVIAGAIGSVLPLLEEMPKRDSGPRLMVLLSSEHGFAGGYNERLMEKADQSLRPDDLLFVMGARGAAVVTERGRKALWQAPMPTRCGGAQDAAIALGEALLAQMGKGKVSGIEVIFSRFRQMGLWSVEQLSLLPLDLTAFPLPQPPRPVPLRHLSATRLLEKLSEDYLQALLTEVLVEAVASENSARFAAMESAHDNVTKKLEQLQQDANLVRQDEITTELLDLVTGAEAAER